MSEVSFGNIELPQEQKKFFFFSFHFCWCFCICERATLYECYSNYAWGYSINNNLQSLKLSIFRCSERWRWWHHPSSAVMIRERIKEKFRNKWSYLFICCHFQTISQAKKLTQLVVFPPKPFFVVIQVHLRQVLVRPIAPHPSVPTLPGQCKAT